MERREFLSNMGITLAVTCTGSLVACSKSGDANPVPNPGSTPSPGGIKATIDLNSKLKNIGDFEIGGGAIVIRLAASNEIASFAALSSTCTHQQCTVARFNNNTSLIECDCHGSRFKTDGSVQTGPAPSPLPKFTIEISGSTLTVKS